MVYNPTMQRWEGNEEALVSFTTLPNSSTTTLALTTASTPTFAPPGQSSYRPHDRSHSISHTALSSIQAAQKSFSSRMAKIAPQPAPAVVPMPVPSPPRPALIAHISTPRGVLHEGRMVFDPVKMKWLKAARPSNDPRSPSEFDDDEEDPFAGIEDFKDNESVAGHPSSARRRSHLAPPGGRLGRGLARFGRAKRRLEMGAARFRGKCQFSIHILMLPLSNLFVYGHDTF
jgi:hypothetical protein